MPVQTGGKDHFIRSYEISVAFSYHRCHIRVTTACYNTRRNRRNKKLYGAFFKWKKMEFMI